MNKSEIYLKKFVEPHLIRHFGMFLKLDVHFSLLGFSLLIMMREEREVDFRRSILEMEQV